MSSKDQYACGECGNSIKSGCYRSDECAKAGEALPSKNGLTVLDEVRQFIAEGQIGSSLMIQMLREIDEQDQTIRRLTRELAQVRADWQAICDAADAMPEDPYKAERDRLRAALFTAQDAMLECQHNAHKGHVCFDGDSWHERLKQVQDALVGSPSETEVGRNHDPSGADRSGLRPDLRAQDQRGHHYCDCGCHQTGHLCMECCEGVPEETGGEHG